MTVQQFILVHRIDDCLVVQTLKQAGVDDMSSLERVKMNSYIIKHNLLNISIKTELYIPKC